MAISFSNNQVKYAQKIFYGKLYFTEDNLGFINKLINKILIFIYLLKYSLINFKRSLINFKTSLINFKTSDSQIFNFSLNIQQDLIDKYSLELKKNNFTYIENFLSKESHDHLLKIFPNINYFKHNKKIIKHYNSNKEWSYKTGFYNRKKNNFLYGFCKYIQSKLPASIAMG